MSQVWSNGSYRTKVAAPWVHTPVHPQSAPNCSVGFYQGAPTKSLPWVTQNLSSVAEGSTPTPQHPDSLQYYEALHPMHPYTTLPLQGGSIMFLQKTVQNALNMVMTGTRAPLGPLQNSGDGPQKSSTAADLTAYQLRNPSSSLPQVVVGASAHCSQKHEDALQKRELRLMKNREAARECRRKKKEYVKCLENRVAVLENQNKTLIEELRALKDIYRHKAE